MVARLAWWWWAEAAPWLLAADVDEPLIRRLDADQRAMLVMALFGISLVGIMLIALISAGGRYVRQQSRRSIGPSRMAKDKWYDKPLVPQDLEAPPREDAQ